jgi:hypothetical protein
MIAFGGKNRWPELLTSGLTPPPDEIAGILGWFGNRMSSVSAIRDSDAISVTMDHLGNKVELCGHDGQSEASSGGSVSYMWR